MKNKFMKITIILLAFISLFSSCKNQKKDTYELSASLDTLILKRGYSIDKIIMPESRRILIYEKTQPPLCTESITTANCPFYLHGDTIVVHYLNTPELINEFAFCVLHPSN